MGKYNKITEKLLAAGYSADNYPKDKVHVATGCYSRSGNPLENIYGGFEYNQIYRDKFVYKTGCGMYVKGERVLSNMSYCGEKWCHENDNPVIRCPFDKAECPDNDSRLNGIFGGGLSIGCWCVCYRTEEPYNYENSFEKSKKERKEEMDRKYQEYSVAHNGRICENHMFYDERTRTWSQSYEPHRCASMCYAKNGDGYCPILGRQLTKKRGNVYYDLKKSGVVKQTGAQSSIFDGNTWTHIEKGIRYFNTPCSMDICKAFVKTQSDKILRDYMLNHNTDFYFDRDLKAEVLNIRAEERPSRDLERDLLDIKAGIDIMHASDFEKREKEIKEERTRQARQRKIEKLENKILKVGYFNLEKIDQRRADKWIGRKRVEELEEIRTKNEQETPVQLSLFDM